MSTLEERLHEALVTEGRKTTVSRDLFERVVGSIEDDRRRRRQLRRTAAAWVVGVAVVSSLVVGLTPRDEEGLRMAWWILEVGTVLVLIGIAFWLGPFIKRFGRAYAADVFHDNPLTGKSYIVLTDVVYYLIFTAYILLTIRTQAEDEWQGLVTADQVSDSLAKVAGILLIIGILHGLNIVLMPVLGRLFSLNRRLPNLVKDD